MNDDQDFPTIDADQAQLLLSVAYQGIRAAIDLNGALAGALERGENEEAHRLTDAMFVELNDVEHARVPLTRVRRAGTPSRKHRDPRHPEHCDCDEHADGQRRVGPPSHRGDAIGRLLTCRGLQRFLEPPSSSGPGHHPFKVAARVRIPLGVPAIRPSS